MTDILDTSEAPLSRTPAQFFFETGYFAAYADVAFRRNGPLLTDAVIERAWDVAREGHPDPVEFDRYLSSANSADARLSEAEATYRAFDEANREADGSREGLTMGAQVLRMYGADLFPANRAGQVHFARVLMDSVASVIDAALAAPKPTAGRPVLDCTGIAMVEVTDADRAEFERGLFTQGYPAERAKQLAFEQKPNDAALQMLARHRLASASAGKLDRDYTARRIKELMDEGDGFWCACSGCQESVDGYVSERDYPFNATFRCQPGGGCSECGGIGVLWEDGRGYGELTDLEDAPNVQRFSVGDWVSHNGGLIETHTKRQITTVIGYDADGGVQYRLATADGSDRGMAYDCELDAWPGDDVGLPIPSPRAAEVR